MISAIANGIKNVASDNYYKNLLKKSKDLKKFRDQYTYSLNFTKYVAQQESLKQEEKKYSDSAYKPVFNSISPLKADLDEAGDDEARKAQKTDWLKAYQKDAGVSHAILISRDLAS
jgi:hypothetical protein